MVELILVRHGETEWNKEFRYQGSSDIPLSEKGINQACLVGEQLRCKRVSRIISSDLQRAVKTAEFIARYHSLHVEEMEEFRELDFGRWEGLTYEEVRQRYPDDLIKWEQCPYNFHPTGGESLAEVYKRVIRGFEYICASAVSEERIVIVTHAGPIRIILGWVLGITHYPKNINIDYGSISIIRKFMDYYFVEKINFTSVFSGVTETEKTLAEGTK